MKIEYTWHEDDNSLHRQYIGDVSICDVLEATLSLQDHPSFPTLSYLIEDYTEATNSPFNSTDVEAFSGIVTLRSRTKGDLMIAIVSRNTPESTGIANHFCEFMQQSHYQCQVFHSVADARLWFAAAVP